MNNPSRILILLGIGINSIVANAQTLNSTSLNPPDSTLNFHSDSVTDLGAVNLVYHRNDYATEKSEYVGKIPVKNIKNPRAYSSISYQQMKDQMVINYTEAFYNIPGSEVPEQANNGRVDISSRGFKVRSQIVDGLSGYTMTNIDPADIQSIEVISGPSSTLYGSSLTSYGGMINIVTKEPYANFGGNLTHNMNSYGDNRLTVDINTPINRKKNVLFRMNAAGELGDSYQDRGFHKTIFVAPTLTYNISNRAKLTGNVKLYKRRATSPFWFTPYKETTIKSADRIGLPKNKSFTSNDVFYNAIQFDARLRADVTLSNAWKSRTGFSFTHSNMDGLMTALVGLSDSTLTRSVTDGPRKYQTIEVQQNFLNKSDFGAFSNHFLLGFDFYHYHDDNSTATVEVGEVNFIHPDPAYYDFGADAVNTSLTNASYKHQRGNQNTYSAYVSDMFSYNQRLHISASLRVDRFENKGTEQFNPETRNWELKGKYQQSALSPNLGLVYEIMPENLSVYTNYMNGFSNVNGSDYEGNTFRPEQANQWELGLKWNLLNNALTGRLSAYNIEVDNIVRTDVNHIDYKIQDGKRLSRGIEFTTTLSPISNLNIIAGYAYNYSKYLKADLGKEDLRPDGAGPANSANVWINYHFTTGKVKGLNVGAGSRYGSKLLSVKGYSQEFIVPNYMVVDANISYSHSFYTIGVKLTNLTNEVYWNNRIMLQPPRAIMGNISIDIAKI